MTASTGDVPGLGRTLRVLVRTSVAADPARSVAAGLLVVLGQCWPLFAAAGVASAVDATTSGRSLGGAAVLPGVAVFVRLLGSPPLATVGYTVRERASARVGRRIVELVSALPGIDHLERPDLLDRIERLQGSANLVGHSVTAVLAAAANIVQLTVTVVLLGRVHPAATLLVAAALLPIGSGAVRVRLRARLDDESGHFWRAKKGLRVLAWAPDHGPDLRLTGAAATVMARQDEAVRGLRRAHDQWAIKGGLAQAFGDAGFGLALVAVVGFEARRVARGEASAGNLVLALVLGQRVSSLVARTTEQVANLANLLRMLGVLAWLEDATATLDIAAADGSGLPDGLTSGVTLDDVSFTYPGSDREVLSDVSVHLPAGARVALVGANGAGKTTLVSLLCGFHEPTSGTISVDGIPLTAIGRRAWQRRATAVFQEATRLEVELASAVGVGDLDESNHIADDTRVLAAVGTAGMADAVAGWADGLGTRLGKRFPGGRGLSGGQWQKINHARSTLRARRLLFVLDEPTAALDAQAEHDLFHRIRTNPDNATAVTLFVSHRFSTVRDADLIIVLDGGRIAEQGTHTELMNADGTYADLYRRQARHYA
jgi:ATP-binding cassette subfamily B protein